jgi:multiple sugar transport system permease protein
MSAGARIGNLLIHAILMIGAIFMVLPMVWMLATSFKQATEIAVWPPVLLPVAPTLANYTGIFEVAPFARFFVNSAGLSIGATLSVAVTSLLAGAVFAKYRFPGRTLLFGLIIATAIVPFESYMIPLYIQLISIGWINTYQGIILPTLFMSFGIFLMRQHVASAIPDDYLEAARIDGASEWWILLRVIAPLSTPALSAIGIFAFIQGWAAFIWPLLVANDQLLFNMEVGLTAFQFKFSTDYGKLMAGSVISTVPMLVIFLILRRRIIESVALTGLKG